MTIFNIRYSISKGGTEDRRATDFVDFADGFSGGMASVPSGLDQHPTPNDQQPTTNDLQILEGVADEASGDPAAVFGGGADIGDGLDRGLGEFLGLRHQLGGEGLADEEVFDLGQPNRGGGDRPEGDGGGQDAAAPEPNPRGGHYFGNGLGFACPDLAEAFFGLTFLGEAEGENDFIGAGRNLAVVGPELLQRDFADAVEGGEEHPPAGDEEGGGGIAGGRGVGDIAAQRTAGLDLDGADCGGGGNQGGQVAVDGLGIAEESVGDAGADQDVIVTNLNFAQFREIPQRGGAGGGGGCQRPTGP